LSTLRSLLAVLGLLATSCGGLVVQPTPVPPTLTAIPAPTLPPRPTQLPTPTPPPPTPTPVPRLQLRIGVELDPPRPAPGTEFVFRLTVSNASDRPAHGAYIATSGPWERYTVLSVKPRGEVARDAAGWHIVSPMEVPGGSTLMLEVRARADEPSDERLTFAVREADPGEL